MNVSKFFSLSLQDIEDIVKKYSLDDLIGSGIDDPFPIFKSLAKKLGITVAGFHSRDYNKRKKVHIYKKANMYGVYSIDHMWNDDTYYIVFFFRDGQKIYLEFRGQSSLSLDIIKLGNYEILADKTKKLSDYIDEHIYLL